MTATEIFSKAEERNGKATAHDGYCWMAEIEPNELLPGIQARIKELAGEDGGEFLNPAEFHITLAYANGALPADYHPPFYDRAFAILIEGLGVFDTPDGYAIHLRVRKDPPLTDIQNDLYNSLVPTNMELSEYSFPDNYKPHITLAYLKRPIDLFVVDPFPLMVRRVVFSDPNETLVHDYALKSATPAPAATFWIGAAIKALDGVGKVGGYLVKFGLPYDAQGEYFMPDTNFHLDWYAGARPVLFHHGMGESEAEAIGHVYELKVDSTGLYAEAELDLNIPVARQVYDEVRRGKIGWSSGSIPHLVKVEGDGRITDWPIVEASLTATPAAGKRTTVQAIKTELTAQPVEPMAKEAERDSGEVPNPESLATKGVNEMTQDQLIAALEKAGIDSETILGIVKELSAAPETPAEMPEAVDAAPVEDVPVEDEDPNMISEKGMQAMQDDKRAEIKAIVQELLAAKAAEPISKADKVGARTAPAVVSPRNKYSHLDYQDLAFLYTTIKAASGARAARGMSSIAPSSTLIREIAVKSLAAHREGRAQFDEAAVKSLQIAAKSDELNYSTLAAGGDEFVAESWRSQIWGKPRLANVVAQNTTFIPMPTDPYVLPIESTDPTVYAVGQTTDEGQLTLADSNSPIPDSKVGSEKATLTSGKMALRVMPTGELEEDAIVPVVTLWREQAVRAMENARDNVLLNADSTTGTSNINLSGSSITGTKNKVLYGGGDGFLHLPLIDNTALAVSMGGAAPTLTKIREMRGKLGTDLIADFDNLAYYVDPLTHVKMLGIDELNVFLNNGQSATVLTGQVGQIDSIPVFVTKEMALASSTGVVSGTAANNLYGRILLVHKPSWIAGYRRDIRINFDYRAEYDAWILVVTMRMALARRSTDCAALLYNIAV